MNTFKDSEIPTEIGLIRSPPEEKGQRIDNVRGFQTGALSGEDELRELQVTAREHRNVFESLVDAVKMRSLG